MKQSEGHNLDLIIVNKIQINKHEEDLIWDNQITEVKGPQPGTEFRLMQMKGSQSGSIQINASEGVPLRDIIQINGSKGA